MGSTSFWGFSYPNMFVVFLNLLFFRNLFINFIFLSVLVFLYIVYFVCDTHSFISLDCCLLLSICVLFRCVLHPLPLPLSSCLGCIPPLIGLPSLRFYAVGSSLFLLSVCFCLCSLFYRDDVLCWLLLVRPFLSAFHAHLQFPV